MEELLRDLVLIFLVAGAVLTAFHRLRLPVIVGLLITGVVIGPYGLGVVRDPEQVEVLANIGIILLMFSIGLDFTPERLRQLARAARLGAFQMLFCIVVTMIVAIAFVDCWAEAVFLGFLVAHTSSTLMLKLFLDRGEFRTPQVRLGLGISIAQDLSVVPMLLLVPLMARGEWAAGAFLLDILRALAALAVALVLARWVVPYWMHHVMRTRSRELYLIFLVVVCLGTAWATLAVGLPVSLGAFLAGLAIAGTQYSDQTLAEVVPFRDLLVSLFFISIGMLLDVTGIWRFALPALPVIAAVLVVKFFSGFLPALLWGSPLRIATVVGLAMAQIGEFSFVLAHVGREEGLIGYDPFQFFVLVAIVTMLLNPFMVAAGPRVTQALSVLPWLRRLEGRGVAHQHKEAPSRENHVVICGYGLNGRNMVRALEALNMPYAALELNPDTVREAQNRGEAVYYGDATRIEILHSVHLDSARVYVVAISDPKATRQTVQLARRENPGLHIIVRTRNLDEIGPLRELGADDVIAQEFETSLEILARTLHSYHLTRQNVEQTIQDIRGNAYRTFRGPSALPTDRKTLAELLPALAIETVSILDGSPAIDRTQAELDLRARTGSTVLAVQRERQLTTVPPPNYKLHVNDVLILAGTPRQVLDAVRMLEPPKASSEKPSEDSL